MRRPIFFAGIAGTLLAFALAIGTTPVHAQIERGEAGGIKYQYGGWTGEAAEQLLAASKQSPLMVVFAVRKSGAYLADVNMQITDAKKKKVFELPGAGPIVLIEMPLGTYEISAEYKGVTQKRTVSVVKGHRQAYLYWADADIEAEPMDEAAKDKPAAKGKPAAKAPAK